MLSIFEFIRTNFFHVVPILIVGGVAVTIVLERSRALVWAYPLQNTARFFEKLRDLIMNDRVSEAIALCDRFPNKPVPQVVKEGLIRAHQPENLIEDGLELKIAEMSQQISKRTQFLSTIANVATLLGLFGTILGLIQSFEGVGAANAQQRSAILASGISMAMNATLLGLAVAIPCMLAFSFLMNRTNRLNAEVEHAAGRTLDILKQHYYSAEVESVHPPDGGQDPVGRKDRTRGTSSYNRVA